MTNFHAATTEREKRQVRADRQSGYMPSEVRDRPDADDLWLCFRRFTGIGYGGETLRAFIAGWDARHNAR